MMDDGNFKTEWMTQPLLDAIRAEYQMDWNGIHGYAHWCRVCENGLLIANENGANRRVVELFAFTHDCKRRNDGHDPQHGLRASQHIRAKLFEYFDLTPDELELLCTACELHTDGRTEGDITIQTCWDADRLDLMRAGIMPEKFYLCTEVARRDEVIQAAVARSCQWADERYRSFFK
jgi:uncharacterized protein